MNQLTQEQYEAVLKYMQTTNEQNFQNACSQLQQHAFNLTNAVNNRFQPTQHRGQARQNGTDDEAIVRRYVQYLHLKNSQWSLISVIWKIVKSLLLILLHSVGKLLPASLFIRYFGNEFQKLYYGRVVYKHQKLSYLLPKTKNINSKSILLVVSPKEVNTQVYNFVTSDVFRKKIDHNFFLSCEVVGSQELKAVEGAQLGPQIIILRMNIFEQIVVIGRLADLNNVSVPMLDRWANDGRNQFRRDGNVLIKYRNYVARYYGQHYEEEEEDQVNLFERQQNTHQIRQQNEAYRAVEQQIRESKKAEQQRMLREKQQAQKTEELLEERRIRKMSIPDEPTSGNIIRISFRCPDGKTIIRNFLAEEKLQLVYNWVQVNEEIEFEDHRRQFQIMYSYPPVPLSSRKEELLSEVFESSQERVAIREL